ncbi:MAG TPA: PQQ-dependent catabolism-associated CXXCW motif protein [Xanthobacteraceae bacterium]
MRCAGLLALWLAIAAGPAPAQAPVPEPDGYRTQDYRAPTPAGLSGARTITTAQAHAIWTAGGAAFVDVLPQPPRPANLPAGTIWRERERLDIPGSLWLPDTGFGELAPAMEDYFRGGLDRATGGNQDKLLVVYCQRDCWMSWNAGKRALALGYRNVAWYPDGTDGWQEAELPMEKAVPAPGRPGE